MRLNAGYGNTLNAPIHNQSTPLWITRPTQQTHKHKPLYTQTTGNKRQPAKAPPTKCSPANTKTSHTSPKPDKSATNAQSNKTASTTHSPSHPATCTAYGQDSHHAKSQQNKNAAKSDPPSPHSPKCGKTSNNHHKRTLHTRQNSAPFNRVGSTPVPSHGHTLPHGANVDVPDR